MTVEVNVARDFSEFPFGRYPDHGPHNGARFRDEFLVPHLKRDEGVIVDLTGARGLAPSFLEEAFGGLIRAGLTADQIDRLLVVQSRTDPSLVQEIRYYIMDAARLAQVHH